MERAQILLQQSRYDLAEAELRRALAADPNDASGHAALGLCLAELSRLQEATEEAQAAVGLAPYLPYAHYALASVLQDRNRLEEAGEAVEEAIRLDPEEPDYQALLSNIWFNRRRWKESLEAAEVALVLDPEHVAANNLRAMALVKLGRKAEAGATIGTALARDPENSLTHANQGWALLHAAEYARALEHFREALRLNPQSEWAREGMVEALKARHLVYGLMLRYFLWMSRLSGKAQWAVLLGGYFAYRVLRDVARHNPGLAPWITPLLFAYGIFALMTWIADPLFNLILRLNRFGRLVLDGEQIRSSNWLGGLVLAALLSLAAGLTTGHPAGVLGALVFAATALPMVAIWRCRPGWPRKAMAAYTGGVGLTGLLGIALAAAAPGSSLSVTVVTVAVAGAVLSGWPANILIAVRPKR
jgi:tetratricopeptide (TPR) repeat protein